MHPEFLRKFNQIESNHWALNLVLPECFIIFYLIFCKSLATWGQFDFATFGPTDISPCIACMRWKWSFQLSSVKTLFPKLRILQGTAVLGGSLLPTLLPTQCPKAKNYYLKKAMIIILIGILIGRKFCRMILSTLDDWRTTLFL